MDAALAASIIDALPGLVLGSADEDASNRFTLEGLTWTPGRDGALEFAIRRFETASLRLASGPLALEVGLLTLHKLAGQVRIEGGRPRVCALAAASAELAGVKLQGPLIFAPP